MTQLLTDFRNEIEKAINRCSAENGSNTPDFILAEYLIRCLDAFDRAIDSRDSWYNIEPKPGWDRKGEDETPTD